MSSLPRDKGSGMPAAFEEQTDIDPENEPLAEVQRKLAPHGVEVLPLLDEAIAQVRLRGISDAQVAQKIKDEVRAALVTEAQAANCE